MLKTTVSERVNILFYILALSATVVVIILMKASGFIENINRISSGSIYTVASSWDIPILIGLPCFVTIILGLFLRLIDQDSPSRISACLNIALVFAIIAIVARLVSGFGLSHYMASKGYSACWELSSPSVMSPTVWVKNTNYCIENAGSIKDELLAWVDSQESAKKDISSRDVKDKTAVLLKVFDQQQLEKYPTLY